MAFFILNSADVQFNKREFNWRCYIISEALPATQRIEFINQKEFTKAALDEDIKTLVIYISSLSLGLRMTIYPAKQV